jgi:PRTRC genetic system protein C
MRLRVWPALLICGFAATSPAGDRQAIGPQPTNRRSSSILPERIEARAKERERFQTTMTIETMTREFRYDNLRLPDIGQKLTVEEIRTAYSATYPEIATASVTGPEAIGNKLVYHFSKAIGTKG